MHSLPTLSFATPLVFALLLALFGRGRETVQKILAVLGSTLTFLIVIGMVPAIKTGEILGTERWFLSFPVAVSFRADSLSIFIAVIFAFCFMLAVIYSLGYMAHGHSKYRYYILLLALDAALLGVVLAASLVGLFIYFEFMAVVSYVLVIHEEDKNAMSAGSKYLFMTIVAGLAIFFGLVVTYHLAGRLDFLPGGYVASSPLAGYALFAFLIGFGLKAGMFPVHIWLPDAHPAAPAPISALLSGCMIKTGAYGLIRIIHYVYGVEIIRSVSFDQVLLALAVITILLGSALALQQDVLKRRLAYSSVAQIGYVLLGIALLTERAMFGALFHVFSHALMKGALFLCAGAIITQTEKKKVSELSGIGFQMPVIMLSFTLAAVTMVGIPPFNAFISKWHLAVASLEVGQGILVGVLILSSLLNALYYFPIVVNAFFKDSGQPQKPSLIRDEVPGSMLWTTALMAVLCVGFAFVQPHWPVQFAENIAAAIFAKPF
ncbi:MAG: proton-conducting transporter membrane subunit [Bacillota bacterium]|nr:proton-conducting transporter membrane subunit [Bacillota bacterium]MDW7683109.1 proton-conducting transporter membrane subunit [Bacillota bacterium]